MKIECGPGARARGTLCGARFKIFGSGRDVVKNAPDLPREAGGASGKRERQDTARKRDAVRRPMRNSEGTPTAAPIIGRTDSERECGRWHEKREEKRVVVRFSDFSLFQARSRENSPWSVMKVEESRDSIFRSRSIYPLFVPRKIPATTQL